MPYTTMVHYVIETTRGRLTYYQRRPSSYLAGNTKGAHMGEGIYIAKRNGTCQHCGHHFFSSSATPGPLCFHCKTSTVVQAKIQASALAVSHMTVSRWTPESGAQICAPGQPDRVTGADGKSYAASKPRPITWGGHTVNAPGFTQCQFDRAMGRAFVDELEVKPDRRPGRYLVGHPQTYAYAVTREHCTCKATAPCKHRALLIAHLDIRVSAIAKQWRQLHEIRPAREAALS